MVHLEHGSAAWEVLETLAEEGLSADRVILAHADRNLDPGLHAELTLAGSYLGYDGMARHREAPDSAILDAYRRYSPEVTRVGCCSVVMSPDAAGIGPTVGCAGLGTCSPAFCSGPGNAWATS